MSSNKKGFTTVEILLVILTLVLVGGAGYFVWNRSQNEASEEQSDSAAPDAEAPAGDAEAAAACTATEGYLVYDNSDVRFCFIYPEGWGAVTLHEGLLDLALESGSGFYGTFSLNENASFGFQSNDWAYNGPGRGGPNHAVGFATYTIFAASPGDTTNYSIKVNTAEKQLVAATTMFNFDGVVVSAMRPFVESEPYTGIDFQLNVPASAGFDYEVDEPDDIVTALQYEQMTTVLDSVTEY